MVLVLYTRGMTETFCWVYAIFKLNKWYNTFRDDYGNFQK